jgi:hypothetical protein
VNEAERTAKKSGARIQILNDPVQAVTDASIVYTDVWASMGQEAETEDRATVFADYRVDRELMSQRTRMRFLCIACQHIEVTRWIPVLLTLRNRCTTRLKIGSMCKAILWLIKIRRQVQLSIVGRTPTINLFSIHRGFPTSTESLANPPSSWPTQEKRIDNP